MTEALKDVGVWLKGLISAGVSAAGSSVAVVIVDPTTFNFQEGIGKVGTVAGVAAIVAIANYLAKSPLPDFPKK